MSGKDRDGPALRYRAFISYNHGDKPVARLLEKRLERFVLPGALRRVKPGLRHDRRPLRPIFRDDDEIIAGQDLISRVGQELEESEFLLVVCSPRSAQSLWVQKEVAAFMALRPDNVIPVVVDGEPHARDAKKECFCPALRETETQGDDGVARERLWVDWRGAHRNKRRNLLSMAAGLLHLRSLDELIQRDAQAQRRVLALRAAIGLFVLVLMGGLAVFGQMIDAGYRSDMLAQRALEANLDESYERAARFAMAGLNLRNAYGLDGASKSETQLRRAVQSARFAPLTLDGHEGSVNAVAYFPDGSRLVSASADGSACVWDARSGAKLSCLAGSPSPIRSIAVSADGQLVAAGSENGSIRLWPAQSGRPACCRPRPSRPCAPWPSRRTARCWPPAPGTARSSCGRCRPGGRSASSSPPNGRCSRRRRRWSRSPFRTMATGWRRPIPT
jgi:hypothetical protein